VELRNRLKTVTGLALSPTLIFDYPTPATLAGHLSQQLGSSPGQQAGDLDEERVRRILRTIPIADLRNAGLLDKLFRVADEGATTQIDPREPSDQSELSAVDVAEDGRCQPMSMSGLSPAQLAALPGLLAKTREPRST
jgi:hypothetical protein